MGPTLGRTVLLVSRQPELRGQLLLSSQDADLMLLDLSGADATAAETTRVVRANGTLRGKPVHVTPTEYKLLRVLLESAGKVVTHERLLREVWGHAAIQSVRRLRVHMQQLRRKFGFAAPFTLHLIAEPAIGYRLWVPA